ncbi:MAG: hypothetical protein OEW73_00320 [Gammaproteobacteria bacterium]|nr:hypothetical protein [Gammaproteobacteria bacterium]MDH5239205.1 hypothetical protein [Gammaproteobacteria bacterium]MDH5260928.1 hypothetical protein [Gammaproteobacteria bacterium]MDH5584756.1 hypothetical protein [Gammaproteobacteria bacterium]
MDHRIGRTVFAIVVGLLVATVSYQWISSPAGREERAIQVSAVATSRLHLAAIVEADSLEIVDPVSPNNKVGKVYIYPESQGWAISGYYRRNADDPWHPYLMTLGADQDLMQLKVRDGARDLAERAARDPRLEIGP